MSTQGMPGDTFLFVCLIAVALLVLPSAKSADRCEETLDFEYPEQKNCFIVPSTSKGNISLSKFKAKNGTMSLKLESEAVGTSVFRYIRPPNFPIEKKCLWRGGIKMWIYKTAAVSGKKMEVRLTDNTNNSTVGSFLVDMGFKGWRGIWISYGECKEFEDSLNSKAKVETVDFVLDHQDTIYIDLLEFVPSLAFQSRDKIVPPITKFGSKYGYRDVWQQSYRWSQTPSPPPGNLDPSNNLSIAHIESRLRNWYCDENITTYDFTGNVKKRWDALMMSIDKAQTEYERLHFKTVSGKSVISGPPLFSLRSTRGSTRYSSTIPTRKFSFIMTKVLQPLAIELHLKSRTHEIARTVIEESPKLKNSKRRKALIRICGKNKKRQDEFLNHLKAQGKPYTKAKVRLSLDYINLVRLERIFSILDYLEDQGWADGSSLGSLYMENLRSSAGFMHSLFLLKDTFDKNATYKNRSLNLIKTAKWYHDFGEVYQSSFEYKGTTADFTITRMLYRLIIVLLMPSDTVEEQKAKQRDMKALKRWMENALTINKALGGLIKPDYTGFHHMAFYASAYIPDALHTAAQVQYLLEGTDFQFSDSAKMNLREALKTLRITAVKYSTPSSVGGRFPDYSKAVLSKNLAAYAYVAVSHPAPLPSVPFKGIDIPELNSNAEIFERLYQPSDSIVAKDLAYGSIKAGKSYFNTLGSIQIIIEVNTKAILKNLTAEISPEGHWSKNFAAFSIHRRSNWAVTVKGLNKFVWDFEGTSSENPNGMFASHGSMLIANSEEVLKAHDVDAGWDWTRIPGTTTLPLTLSETKLEGERNYSPQSSAGGVTFQGPEPSSNGVFGMDFNQPKYEFKDIDHPYPNIKSYFKKSVFFYQNLLVCLGSNIRVTNGRGTKAQTTLFQDKLVRGSSNFSIEVDGVIQGVTAPFSAMTPYNQNGAKSYTILLDTKGNSYYIPQASAPDLKVHVQNQTSESQKGEPSNGYYATAWLEHGSVVGIYEYAVYVNTTSYARTAEEAWFLQEDKKLLYKVLKQDHEAHVVKFLSAPDSLTAVSPLYGYAIFQPIVALQWGPIKAVNKQCRIMARESDMELYISISYPDLDFNTSRVLTTLKDVRAWEMFHMESKENEVEVTLTADVDKNISSLFVHGSPADYAPVVRVESSSSSPPNKGNQIVFANLKNGFSVEIKLNK